jgi:hypothetical protein
MAIAIGIEKKPEKCLPSTPNISIKATPKALPLTQPLI